MSAGAAFHAKPCHRLRTPDLDTGRPIAVKKKLSGHANDHHLHVIEAVNAALRLAVLRLMSFSISVLICVSFKDNTCAVFHWVNTDH